MYGLMEEEEEAGPLFSLDKWTYDGFQRCSGDLVGSGPDTQGRQRLNTHS